MSYPGAMAAIGTLRGQKSCIFIRGGTERGHSCPQWGANGKAARLRAGAVLAQTSGRISVAGLKRPVTILSDPWGVAHVYAETQEDLFFAQGFVAAQERLWQLDLWRRVGEGRLAEILGPKAVPRDRF